MAQGAGNESGVGSDLPQKPDGSGRPILTYTFVGVVVILLVLLAGC